MVIKRELTRLASFYLKMINHVLTGGVLKNEQTKIYIYTVLLSTRQSYSRKKSTKLNQASAKTVSEMIHPQHKVSLQYSVVCEYVLMLSLISKLKS